MNVTKNERRKVHIQRPIRVAKQPNRNAKCPCGSGKKYKRCCGSRVGIREDLLLKELTAKKGSE